MASLLLIPVVFTGIGLALAARVRNRGSRIAIRILVVVVGFVALYGVFIGLYKHGYLGPT